MSELPRPFLTAAEYLERERNADYKSEYYRAKCLQWRADQSITR
jgi:hypothetical protein